LLALIVLCGGVATCFAARACCGEHLKPDKVGPSKLSRAKSSRVRTWGCGESNYYDESTESERAPILANQRYETF
jgi:hypothetical protein